MKTSLAELAKILEKPPHDKFVSVYTEKRKENNSMKPSKKIFTLNQIGEMVLGIKNDLKHVNTRLDRIEKRLDLVEKRLDYNNLKRLPKNY